MSVKSLPMQEDFKMFAKFAPGDLVWPMQKWWAVVGIFYKAGGAGLVTQVLQDSGPLRLGFYYVVLLDGIERTIHETSLSPRPDEE